MDVCCQGGFAMGQRIFARVARRDCALRLQLGHDAGVLAAAHLGICSPASGSGVVGISVSLNFGRPGMYPFQLARRDFARNRLLSNAET